MQDQNNVNQGLTPNTIINCHNKMLYFIKNAELTLLEEFLNNQTIKNICGTDGWDYILNSPINADGDTLLIWASFWGHEQLVSLLLADPAIDLYKTDKYGFTAQISARHAGRVNIAYKLKLAMDEKPQKGENKTAPPALCFEDDAGKDNFNEWLSGMIKPSSTTAYKKTDKAA